MIMDYPKLRYVEAFPSQMNGQAVVCLRDPQTFTDKVVFLPYNLFYLVSMFDGQHSILDMQAAYARQFGNLIFSDHVKNLIEQLDEHLFLDSDRFHEYRRQLEEDFTQSPVRKAAHAGGAYEAEPEKLIEQLDRLFALPDGPGQPVIGSRAGSLKAAIVPHIDVRRGSSCYAIGYKEIGEAADADLFILLGTDHCAGTAFFTMTRKDFETPLGRVETDRAFIDELQGRYGGGDLFANEISHRSEHSIEFQVIFLQYLFNGKRPFTIVPILCASFHEMLVHDILPVDHPRAGVFMRALKETIMTSEVSGKRMCLIVGADLAHMGQRFGDHEPLTPGFFSFIEAEDRALLDRVMALDREGFFRMIQKDQDRRRICGFPSISTLLSTVEGTRGELLKYDQAVDLGAQSVVSFAGLVIR
ncbi:MAG: AmmeMemoRadiSam system protein B [Candidatus Latescibacteria bacterium]|nr:AmmeMemoRadiSam system protein B [Candidatus Latescibacterota bacterium]